MTQEIVERLIDYVKSTKAVFSEDEYNIIRNTVGLIIEPSPQTAQSVFSRSERLIAASTNLSWITLSLNRTKMKLENSLKSIKDPEFVILVRQGRPSTQAIESEIRFNKPSVMELESSISDIDNLIAYFENLERNVDRYIRTLREKAAFIR